MYQDLLCCRSKTAIINKAQLVHEKMKGHWQLMDRSSFNPKFMLYFHHLCPYPLAQGAISIALCDQTDFYQHLSDAKLIYVMILFILLLMYLFIVCPFI